MQNLGKFLRGLVLLIGLGLVVGGLFCGTLGLMEEPVKMDGVLRIPELFVAIGALALGLGGLLVFFMVRSFNRSGPVDTPMQNAKDDLPQ